MRETNVCLEKKVDYMFFVKKGYEEWRYIFPEERESNFPKVKLISEEVENQGQNQSGDEIYRFVKKKYWESNFMHVQSEYN